MDIRKRLVKFLSELRAFQLTDERQAFIGIVGFDHFRAKINWEGDAQAFADHLVLVLTRHGRKTLLSFIANLQASNKVGLDRKAELETVRLAIANLTRPQWVKQFVFVALPVKWIIAGLVLLLFSAAPTAWWAYQVWRAPAEMTGTFNVALADFAQLGNGGQAQAVEDGRTMSTWLFKGLAAQALGPNFSIWHDSMDLTEKRVTIGVIPGSTREARLTNAVKVAKSINADMLVYGVLAGGASTELELEFYLAPLTDQVDEQGDEIVGTYALGSPISVTLPVRYSQSRAEVEDVLLDRSKILTLFAQGLNRDKTRRPAEALRYFQNALDEKLWSSDTRGQEVIYLFIGRQHYGLAADYAKKGQTGKALEEYRKAHEAYGQAKAINPEYARAYVGDGNVYYALAKQAPPAERVGTPCVDLAMPDEILEASCLELATKEYKRAAELADRPGGSGAYADIKAHIALGLAYRTEAEAYMFRNEFDTAIPFFDMAIEEQGKVLALLEGQDQPGYLALTNLNLGAAYHQKGHVIQNRKKAQELQVQQDGQEAGVLYEMAHAAYTQCMEPASAQPGDRELQALAARCESLRNEVDKVRADLGTQP